MHLLHPFALLTATALGALAAPFNTRDTFDSPGTVSVQTRFQGTYVGLNSDAGDQFFGIPYAQPPVGDLRFGRTRALPPSTGVRQATKAGAGCIQPLSSGVVAASDATYSEDCLFLNIYRPAPSARTSSLPVMVYIHGGGWVDSSSTMPRYNATNLVARSVQLGEPIIFVSFNYRLGAFGFLAGPEADLGDKLGNATLNAGYWDQRTALKWIQSEIALFGGDPARVTLVGQSAGANGVAAQMLANGGQIEGLFRAAILQSGSQALTPRHRASDTTPTLVYKTLLKEAGCLTFTCLRRLNANKLLVAQQAVQATTLNPFNFLPVRDRFFVTELPSAQFAAGRFPNIPIISGGAVDEGTLFSPTTIDSDVAFTAVLVVLGGALVAPVLPQISLMYPDDPKVGSPYRPELMGYDGSERYYDPRTTNQFKRLSAVLGDVLIHAGRRQQLQASTKRVNSWSYIFAQPDPVLSFSNPAIGIAHGSDIEYVFNQPPEPFTGLITNTTSAAAALYANPLAIQRTTDLMSAAWIHFVNNMSPAGQDVPDWPTYGAQAQALQIQGVIGTKMVTDDFHKEQVQYILDNPLTFEN